jgi:hypothetical protein
MKPQELVELMERLRQSYGNQLMVVRQHPMRNIQRTDIVGARIVDIHQTWEIREVCDEVVVYFTVDRGFTFTLPYAGEAWATVELPANAERLPDESVQEAFAVKHGWFGLMRFVRLPSTKSDIIRQTKQRAISGVYCGPFDKSLDFYYPADGRLVFEDGAQALNTTSAPSGTGGAGFYFFPAGSPHCARIGQMVDYFTIPVEGPAHV